jgi:hypothetical protein
VQTSPTRPRRNPVLPSPQSSAGVPVQGLSPPGGGCQFGPGSGARHSRCQSAGAYGPPGFHRGDAERRCGRSRHLTQDRINFQSCQERNRNKLSQGHGLARPLAFPLAGSLCPAKATPTTRGSPSIAERWQSGRSRRTRNAKYSQGYRGFESLPLRHSFPGCFGVACKRARHARAPDAEDDVEHADGQQNP